MEETKNENFIQNLIKRIPHGITLWYLYFFFISLYGSLLTLIYHPIGSLIFPYYLSFHFYLLVPITIIASVISERYSSKWYQYMLYHLGITSFSSAIIIFVFSSNLSPVNFFLIDLISILIYLPYSILDWFLKVQLYSKTDEETKFRRVFTYISKKITSITCCISISLVLLQILGLGKWIKFLNYSLYISFTLSFLTDFIQSRLSNKTVHLMVYFSGGLIASLVFFYWYSYPIAILCASVFCIFWLSDSLSRRMLQLNQKAVESEIS